MNTYFTVGELAKLSHLSKQTLIFYDKKNVFKPKYIDPKNGYRRYTADQLEVLDSILTLKEMGLSLQEIREFMQNRDSSFAVSIMKTQLSKNEEKIKSLKLVSKRLERKMQTIENYLQDEKNITIIMNNANEYLAVEKVKSPNGLLQLDIAYKQLLNRASCENYTYYYQLGAMIPIEELQQKKYLWAEYAFVPVERKQGSGDFLTKPKGMYMRGYHTGTYEQIGLTYEKMLQSIQSHGYHAHGYSYEYCVLDSLTSQKSLDYVTEIQIPICKDE